MGQCAFGSATPFVHVFTARCTIVRRAVLRLHVARLSVCNVGGSGSYRLEILETNCTWTISKHGLPTPIDYTEILGRIEVGGEKVVCWSTKAAISLKRVKIEEKLPWRTCKNSLNALSDGRPTISHLLLLPSVDWRFATDTQNSNRYYLRNG